LGMKRFAKRFIAEADRAQITLLPESLERLHRRGEPSSREPSPCPNRTSASRLAFPCHVLVSQMDAGNSRIRSQALVSVQGGRPLGTAVFSISLSLIQGATPSRFP
jgi:hypothetical protein